MTPAASRSRTSSRKDGILPAERDPRQRGFKGPKSAVRPLRHQQKISRFEDVKSSGGQQTTCPPGGYQSRIGIDWGAPHDQLDGGIQRVVLDQDEDAAWFQDTADLGCQPRAQRRVHVMIEAHRGHPVRH